MAQTTARDKAAALVRRRHPEFTANATRLQWLQDSLEGGDRYRNATYGFDRMQLAGGQAFQATRRNLIRHKHEQPDPTTGEEDRNYWLRWVRTPVPSFVAECVETHLAEVYGREITRKGPEPIRKWWSDVDGAGTTIDEWMGDTVAPLLMALGQLDLIFDRPKPPEGEPVRSRADQVRNRLDRCIAGIILPEAMLWWRLEPVTGRYLECLVDECSEDGEALFRHWTAAGSTLYDDRGRAVESVAHGYGRVPVVRVFDRRHPKQRNIGMSRYEAIAELQREAYNKESELVLSNALHAHPTVQAPEDFLQADASVPIGPGFVLPKKKSNISTGGSTYEPWEYLEPPTGPAESLRADLARIREQVDRAAKLTKPAGASGTGKGTVAQSGISKALDQKSGNAYLAKISAVLRRAERTAAEFVGVVLDLGPAADAAATVAVSYPRTFNLLTAEELSKGLAEFQGALAASGECPDVEVPWLQEIVHVALPGREDAELAAWDRGIVEAVRRQAAERSERREAGPDPIPPPKSAAPPAEPGAEDDEGDEVEESIDEVDDPDLA